MFPSHRQMEGKASGEGTKAPASSCRPEKCFSYAFDDQKMAEEIGTETVISQFEEKDDPDNEEDQREPSGSILAGATYHI